jgi:rare lipoprotein A
MLASMTHSHEETGIASWYSVKTNRGTQTASGEKFNENALTAAHKKLKFGTLVRVTNLSNKKSIVVRINDRGPFIKGRIIDLSVAGAKALGFYKNGITKVKIETVQVDKAPKAIIIKRH